MHIDFLYFFTDSFQVKVSFLITFYLALRSSFDCYSSTIFLVPLRLLQNQTNFLGMCNVIINKSVVISSNISALMHIQDTISYHSYLLSYFIKFLHFLTISKSGPTHEDNSIEPIRTLTLRICMYVFWQIKSFGSNLVKLVIKTCTVGKLNFQARPYQ